MTIQPKPEETKKSEFDADFSPDNPVNKAAAIDNGVKYDPITESYKDEDGCMIYDKFGQRY